MYFLSKSIIQFRLTISPCTQYLVFFDRTICEYAFVVVITNDDCELRLRLVYICNIMNSVYVSVHCVYLFTIALFISCISRLCSGYSRI